MPSSTKPAWLQADRKTKVILSGCTPSHIHSKCSRASLPCPCMAHPPRMAFQETTSRDGILLNKSPSILHAPTFCIHFNQAISHKRNLLTTTLNDLLMSTPAFFKCKDTSTCIQHPHKSDRVWLHTFLLPLLKIVPVPSSLAHISHVPIPWWSR